MLCALVRNTRALSPGLALLIVACSSTATSSSSEGPDGGADAASPPIDPSLLGGVCSGGCGIGAACAVPSEQCASGLCAVDYRFEQDERWLGCTSSCKTSTCPADYECVDVDGGERMCMALPQPTLEWTLSTYTPLSTFDVVPFELELKGPIPSPGDKEGCGVIRVEKDNAEATTLFVGACAKDEEGTVHRQELTFTVPKSVGPSKASMLASQTLSKTRVARSPSASRRFG